MFSFSASALLRFLFIISIESTLEAISWLHMALLAPPAPSTVTFLLNILVFSSNAFMHPIPSVLYPCASPSWKFITFTAPMFFAISLI